MSLALKFALTLLLMAIIVGGVMWMMARQFRNSSEDKIVIITKWVLTLLVVVAAVAAYPLFYVFGFILRSVPLRTPVNIDDYRCRVLWKRVGV